MKRLLHRGVFPGLSGVVLGLAILASVAAAPAPNDPVKGKAPPANLDKKDPDGVADLKAMQDQVKTVLKKVMPATVGVLLGPGAGSGVIVREEGIVLTAGHVSGKPEQSCTLVFPDGTRVKGKTLGYNKRMDSGMIKITDKPPASVAVNGKFPFVPTGDSTKLKRGQWLLAVGHPGGYRIGRTPPVRLGRVLRAEGTLIQTDCALVGGDSGGPLFDLNGNVVGIHSRISWSLSANIHVPVNAFKDDWDRLAKGEEWGGVFDFLSRPANQGYMGVVFDQDSDDLKVAEITKDSPASKAGFKVGDVIVQIDNEKFEVRKDLMEFMKKKKIGDEVTVHLLRDDKPMKLTLKLGKRPSSE
jgi:serine protease Do